MRKSDHYVNVIEWSEEDQCYVGSCPELMLGGVHGANETEVFRHLCAVVEQWIRIAEEDGEPLPPGIAGKSYSGKFVLRTGGRFHKELAISALRAGKSLNAYCVDLLKEAQQKRRGDPTLRR